MQQGLPSFADIFSYAASAPPPKQVVTNTQQLMVQPAYHSCCVSLDVLLRLRVLMAVS